MEKSARGNINSAFRSAVPGWAEHSLRFAEQTRPRHPHVCLNRDAHVPAHQGLLQQSPNTTKSFKETWPHRLWVMTYHITQLCASESSQLPACSPTSWFYSEGRLNITASLSQETVIQSKPFSTDTVEVGQKMCWLSTKASLGIYGGYFKKKWVWKDISKGGTQVQAKHKISSSTESAWISQFSYCQLPLSTGAMVAQWNFPSPSPSICQLLHPD